MSSAPPASIPAPAAGVDRKLTLKEVLEWAVVDGHVARQDAARLLADHARARGGKHPITYIAEARLRSAVVAGGTLNAEGITAWLAARLHMPFFHIDPLKIDLRAVTDVMSSEYAQRRGILPVEVNGKEVTIATCEPFMRGCTEEGIDYRGILYPGVMLTKIGPKVLEFNARFGDPETQVYLTRFENDLVELLDASVCGTLGKIELKWSPLASVCVVMASGGYPGNYAKGKVITGLEAANALPQTKVFHAGTALAGDQIVTSGGRVLGVTALGKDLKTAQAAAYAAMEKIHFEGAQFRRDIAAKAL